MTLFSQYCARLYSLVLQVEIHSPFDIHLVAYSSLMQILSKFHLFLFSTFDPSSSPSQLTVLAVAMYKDRLRRYQDEWAEKLATASDQIHSRVVSPLQIVSLYIDYSRLLMFSSVLTKVFQRGMKAEDEPFVNRSLKSALSLITFFVDSLVPTGCFAFVTFASICLLTLLHHKYTALLSVKRRAEIISTVSRLIEIIGSPAIAIDERHAPKSYSRVLTKIISSSNEPTLDVYSYLPHFVHMTPTLASFLVHRVFFKSQDLNDDSTSQYIDLQESGAGKCCMSLVVAWTKPQEITNLTEPQPLPSSAPTANVYDGVAHPGQFVKNTFVNTAHGSTDGAYGVRPLETPIHFVMKEPAQSVLAGSTGQMLTSGRPSAPWSRRGSSPVSTSGLLQVKEEFPDVTQS
ncbi:hypothetical protein BV25DRAFT_1915792 [Artomyces pyxidatus]|uniref:Uncharacterized protein n=1 Tax=Artomyces pyxidatus TaxID=48021 RepID=A0ACB8T2L9_9AGAM|nr:hypothetical protein BV25DRAFT_1915792 [Artomyces pyxidatus]